MIRLFRQGKERDSGRFGLVAKKFASVDNWFMSSLFKMPATTSNGLKCPVAGIDARTTFVDFFSRFLKESVAVRNRRGREL